MGLTAMEPKSVAFSSETLSQVMLLNDANPTGNVHGGTIMKLVDTAGGIVAMKHSGRICVTVRIDSMSFEAPVYVGDLLTVRACINDVGHTSMEVGVRVEAETLITGEVRHISTAYLVYVALGDDGRPTAAPPLQVETPEDARRQSEAKLRREHRLVEAEAIKQLRQGAVCNTGCS
jgi:acyl-CoA hydrolase